MAALYQRAPGALLLPALLLGGLADAGCGGRAEPPAKAAELAPRRDPLVAFFESAGFEPAVAAAAAAPIAATRWSGTGALAVWIGDAGGRGEPILPGETAPSRALASLGAGRALVEVASPAPAEPPGWLLAGPGPARRRIGPPPGERWRLLGAATGRPALFAAASTNAGGPDRLIEIGPGGESRALAEAPAGLIFEVVAGDGRRAALVRHREPEADELYLFERATGETTLLLPEEENGRFRPLAFSADGDRLLLISDDRDELPRAEWLDLRDRSRRPASDSTCAATGARVGPDGTLALEVACAGRNDLLLVDGATGERLAPPPAPSGARPVAAWPTAAEAPLLFQVAGPRWPRDLWRAETAAGAHPLTYGLAARIDAADLVEPDRVLIATPDGQLPGELWRPRRPDGSGSRAGLVWLESDARPLRWFEFDPLCQFLAQRGVAVLRVRPRGSDALPNRLRAVGEGRRGELAVADAELARRELVERADVDPARIALLGEGGWNGAAAAALAAQGEPGFALFVALDPDPDPLAPPPVPVTAPPRGGRPAIAPDPALERRRALFRLGAAAARRPLVVVADTATPRGAAVRAALDGAVPPGAGARWANVATPPLGAPRLDLRLAALLFEEMRPLFGAARPAATPP